jgi:hypothetical protein
MGNVGLGCGSMINKGWSGGVYIYCINITYITVLLAYTSAS